MAGLRMVWIDDAAGHVPGALAKAAYQLMGHWAFNHTAEWLAFIYARDWKRLDLLATSLTAAFAGQTPPGAPNPSPRVLIKYDEKPPPPPMTDAMVSDYHKLHQLVIVEDGTLTTSLVFKGDPTIVQFGNYMGDYGTDDGEGAINTARAEKMFAMALMTRCR